MSSHTTAAALCGPLSLQIAAIESARAAAVACRASLASMARAGGGSRRGGGGAGTSRGRGPPPSAQEAAAARFFASHSCSPWQLQADQGSAIMLTASQALNVMTQCTGGEGCSGVGQIRALLVLVACAILLAATTLCPKVYGRYRSWLLPIVRVLYYSPLSTKQVKVGTALLLERQPLLGRRGALLDLARIATGVRAGAVAVQGVLMMLPPTATLITQSVLAVMTANSAGYCTTQLLTAPLTQQRLARAAAVFEYAAAPIMPLHALAAGSMTPLEVLSEGDAPPQLVCRAVLSFLHIVLGALLPTLLSAYSWRPDPTTWVAARGCSSGSSSSSSWWWCWEQLSRPLRQAVAALDWFLHFTLNLGGSVVGRCLVCWWLLSYTWLCCKLAAGLL